MRSDRQVLARFLFAAVVVSSVAGCAQTRDWLDSVTRRDSGPKQPVILGAPLAEDYLRDLERLATGDPAVQAELFAETRSKAMLTPDTSTTLRYALMLATPGHAESESERAQSLLRDLLADTSLLTPAEVALARIYLQSVEDRIVLAAEARRLRQSTSRKVLTEEQAINRRLASVEAENRRLRAELQEAERKLEAITTIEQSIRDQEQ